MRGSVKRLYLQRNIPRKTIASTRQNCILFVTAGVVANALFRDKFFVYKTGRFLFNDPEDKEVMGCQLREKQQNCQF